MAKAKTEVKTDESKTFRFNLFTGKGDEQYTCKSEAEKAAKIKEGMTVEHPDNVKAKGK